MLTTRKEPKATKGMATKKKMVRTRVSSSYRRLLIGPRRCPRGPAAPRGQYRLRLEDAGARGGLLKVALTGASGYTGGRLLARLLARGDEVAALVRSASL